MKRVAALVTVFVLCVVLGAPAVSWAAKPAAAAQVTINGVVSDVGGSALGGATIAVSRLVKGVYSPVAELTSLPDGTWTYSDKRGSYRFEITAAGYEAFVDYVTYDANGTYTHSAALTPLPPPSGTITGRVVRGATETPIANTNVWFYKMNPDGTYPPTSPGWGSPTKTVYTDAAGNYTSGDLGLGTYKVRFWGGSMTGSQWWQYVTTVELATPVELTFAGQTVGGIDGWFGKP